MSSWNTGPFDNDMAVDFLDLMGEMSADDRRAELVSLFTDAIEDPDGESRFVALQAVIAGAALVAASLSGGAAILDHQQEDVSDELARVLPISCDFDLIRHARDAVHAITRPHQTWSLKWLNDEDRLSARRGVDAIVKVLTVALSGPRWKSFGG